MNLALDWAEKNNVKIISFDFKGQDVVIKYKIENDYWRFAR